MRWKFSGSGHDPRQIDLLAIIALLMVIGGAYGLFCELYRNTAEHTGLPRAEPKRALVEQRADWQGREY
jgi:hypothetical protein